MPEGDSGNVNLRFAVVTSEANASLEKMLRTMERVTVAFDTMQRRATQSSGALTQVVRQQAGAIEQVRIVQGRETVAVQQHTAAQTGDTRARDASAQATRRQQTAIDSATAATTRNTEATRRNAQAARERGAAVIATGGDGSRVGFFGRLFGGGGSSLGVASPLTGHLGARAGRYALGGGVLGGIVGGYAARRGLGAVASVGAAAGLPIAGGLFGVGALGALGTRLNVQEQNELFRIGTVSGIAPGIARDSFLDQSRSRAFQFGVQQGRSPNDYFSALYSSLSAGLSRELAPQVAEATQNVAALTRGDLPTVGATISGLANIYGTSPSRIADLLTQTQFQYQFDNFGELGYGLSYAAPDAAVRGIPVEDLLATIGQLNTKRIPGSQAGTAIRSLLPRLTSPDNVADLDRLSRQQGGPGYAPQFYPSGGLNLPGTFSAASQIYARATPQQQAILSDIFAQRAASAAGALIGDVEGFETGRQILTSSYPGVVQRELRDERGRLPARLASFQAGVTEFFTALTGGVGHDLRRTAAGLFPEAESFSRASDVFAPGEIYRRFADQPEVLQQHIASLYRDVSSQAKRISTRNPVQAQGILDSLTRLDREVQYNGFTLPVLSQNRAVADLAGQRTLVPESFLRDGAARLTLNRLQRIRTQAVKLNEQLFPLSSRELEASASGVGRLTPAQITQYSDFLGDYAPPLPPSLVRSRIQEYSQALQNDDQLGIQFPDARREDFLQFYDQRREVGRLRTLGQTIQRLPGFRPSLDSSLEGLSQAPLEQARQIRAAFPQVQSYNQRVRDFNRTRNRDVFPDPIPIRETFATADDAIADLYRRTLRQQGVLPPSRAESREEFEQRLADIPDLTDAQRAQARSLFDRNESTNRLRDYITTNPESRPLIALLQQVRQQGGSINGPEVQDLLSGTDYNIGQQGFNAALDAVNPRNQVANAKKSAELAQTLILSGVNPALASTLSANPALRNNPAFLRAVKEGASAYDAVNAASRAASTPQGPGRVAADDPTTLFFLEQARLGALGSFDRLAARRRIRGDIDRAFSQGRRADLSGFSASELAELRRSFSVDGQTDPSFSWQCGVPLGHQ